MDIQSAIKAVIARQDLSSDEMRSVMQQIMTGECTASQIGGFLVGLRMKGETLSLIHISEPTRPVGISRMPSSA